MQERRRAVPPDDAVGYLQQLPARLLLNRLPIPMLALGRRGDIGYANSSCAEMLGFIDGATVARMSLPELLSGHCADEPEDCVATLRTAGTIVEWNHCQGHVIRTIVSQPLLMRAADELLLISITDVTDWLWERGPTSRVERNETPIQVSPGVQRWASQGSRSAGQTADMIGDIDGTPPVTVR